MLIPTDSHRIVMRIPILLRAIWLQDVLELRTWCPCKVDAWSVWSVNATETSRATELSVRKWKNAFKAMWLDVLFIKPSLIFFGFWWSYHDNVCASQRHSICEQIHPNFSWLHDGSPFSYGSSSFHTLTDHGIYHLAFDILHLWFFFWIFHQFHPISCSFYLVCKFRQ